MVSLCKKVLDHWSLKVEYEKICAPRILGPSSDRDSSVTHLTLEDDQKLLGKIQTPDKFPGLEVVDFHDAVGVVSLVPIQDDLGSKIDALKLYFVIT